MWAPKRYPRRWLPPLISSFGHVHVPHVPRKYGKWYIPADLWQQELWMREARERGEDLSNYPDPEFDKAEGDADLHKLWREKPLTEVQEQMRVMASQIVNVYSAKLYKQYIKKQHGARIPHYLTRVETPPPEKSNVRKSGYNGRLYGNGSSGHNLPRISAGTVHGRSPVAGRDDDDD